MRQLIIIAITWLVVPLQILVGGEDSVINPVPEPSTLILMGTGIGIVLLLAKRNRRKR